MTPTERAKFRAILKRNAEKHAPTEPKARARYLRGVEQARRVLPSELLLTLKKLSSE